MEPEPVFLIDVDIDRFKHINDSIGYSQGDELIRAFARRLKEIMPAFRMYGGRKQFTMGGPRLMAYGLPDLPIARQQFSEKIKKVIDWEDADDIPF